MKSSDFAWNEVLKKEARGINDADSGDIESVDPDHVITQKGIIDKEFSPFQQIWFKEMMVIEDDSK